MRHAQIHFRPWDVEEREPQTLEVGGNAFPQVVVISQSDQESQGTQIPLTAFLRSSEEPRPRSQACFFASDFRELRVDTLLSVA